MPTPDGNRRRAVRRKADTGEFVHARFDQLVELASDGILVHDGERIVFANLSAVRLVGASSNSELLGLPIGRLLDPPFLKSVEAELLTVGYATAPPVPIRDRLRRLDGSVLDVEVTAIAFLDGDLLAVHLVIRDISERILIERLARRSEEHLHESRRMDAVGALAGGVAHEVNNMMTVVIGLGDIVLHESVLPEAARSDVQAMMQAAERAASITRQVLAFSRRDFHQPQNVDVAALVQRLEPLLRQLLGERLELAIETEGDALVWADPGQLEQVIVNLAVNARDALQDGGSLTITTAETEFGEDREFGAESVPSGRYAALTARDTGIGMSSETLNRAFEPFFTTKPIGQGSGLGLAAAYGIIKQNGGYITAASQPGSGSQFTILLPLLPDNRTAQRREPPGPQGDASAPRATILLVEDEPAVRAIGSRCLRAVGFRVIEASDGAQALAAVAQYGRPHLIVTDVMVAGVRGTQLTQRIGERWPGIPVVYMSGYTREDLLRQGETEVEELIPKPFYPRAFVDTVVRVLGSRSDRREARPAD